MPSFPSSPVEGPAQQDRCWLHLPYSVRACVLILLFDLSEVSLREASKRVPISRMPSMGSFPDSDSYAFSHNEDLGFSIFLERR